MNCTELNRLPAFAAIFSTVLLTALSAAAEERTGEQIYQQQCAACHGAKGEGIKDEYPQPLVGDRSVGELSRLIAKTMPKGSVGECVGPDAQKVAAYIHDAFYSKLAQARNQPPRVEFARLTVRQYRNAVADLIGSFRDASPWGDERGLRGEYYKSRRTRSSDRVIERVDPTVQFDFAEGSPDKDKIDPKEFTIRWQGSVLVPETGECEFIVKTANGARLWVNDDARALIDVWVKSGSDTQFGATRWLLGGRVYPLRLEFLKSKEKTASIELWWKLPGRAAEPIPARNLSPVRVPETLAVSAPFPPDDRSIGYERGSSISRAWDQATTDAAIEVAGYVASHLPDLAGQTGDTLSVDRLKAFCWRFAERAFRRPLTDEQKQLYIVRQFAEAGDPHSAVKRVVLLALKSPRFLYREAPGGTDSYDAAAYDNASRISFALWDSLPDPTLLRAAAAGELATREQVVAQAERMAADPRARAKLREFFLQWLKVDQPPDLSKDPKRFAEFDEAIASDLRTSLELLLDEIVWSEAADFRQLLTADTLHLNGRLAQFYGVDLPADAPFQKVALDGTHRSGVLSHPYLMAGFAYTGTSSPIHRGVFISRSLLGRTLRPPPEAVSPLAPDLHPNLTTRERIDLQTSAQACQVCHNMINPLGFTLEHFDAVGRYREREQERLVDASGSYETNRGDVVKFTGVRELATFLAGSEETHAAFVEQLFQHLIKQPIRAYGLHKPDELRKTFAENSFHIRRLMIEIVAASCALETAR